MTTAGAAGDEARTPLVDRALRAAGVGGIHALFGELDVGAIAAKVAVDGAHAGLTG